ncbi:MAG: Cof-type HAD-IIB family hydrolase [Bacillota bacterium]|nr:Cof-type HAD-IIB family hydrolase [Bacillota bacterium]
MREKPPIRLLALDLDDTLLGNDKKIHPDDRLAIHKAREKGIRPVIVTGRHWLNSHHYAEELGDDVPVIATGGASIHGPRGELWQVHRLSREAASQMVRWAQEADVAVRVDYELSWFYNRRPDVDFWNDQKFPDHMGPHEHIDPDVLEKLPEDPLQVLTGGKDAVALLKAFGYLDGQVRVLPLPDPNDPRVVHMTHSLATKGIALAWLAEKWGLRREEVMAFGDGANDIPMMCYAGISVASDRAIPAVRLLADAEMEGPGGIALMLEKYGLL